MTTVRGVTQETITQASSPIPNETFRYQVKFLALSKAQTKVLPLPCPILVPRRGHWSNSIYSRASSGGWSTVELSRPPHWFQRTGSNPPDDLEGSWSPHKAFHLSHSLLRESLDPEQAILRERPPQFRSVAGQVSSSFGGQIGRTII